MLKEALVACVLGCVACSGSGSGSGGGSPNGDATTADSGEQRGCIANCDFFADAGSGDDAATGDALATGDGGSGSGACCVAGDLQLGDKGCFLPSRPICCLAGTYTASDIGSTVMAGGPDETACCGGGANGPASGITRSDGAKCNYFCDCGQSVWSGSTVIVDACVHGFCGARLGQLCGALAGAPNPVPCVEGVCLDNPSGGGKTCQNGDAGSNPCTPKPTHDAEYCTDPTHPNAYDCGSAPGGGTLETPPPDCVNVPGHAAEFCCSE